MRAASARALARSAYIESAHAQTVVWVWVLPRATLTMRTWCVPHASQNRAALLAYLESARGGGGQEEEEEEEEEEWGG